MTDDPNLVPISSPEALYKPLPAGVKRRDYTKSSKDPSKPRTLEEIAVDLILANRNLMALEERDNQRIDTINRLIRQKDSLLSKDLDQQGEIEVLQKKQGRTSIWTAVLVTSVTPVWGIIAKVLYGYLSRHK